MPDNRLGPQLTSPDPRDALPVLALPPIATGHQLRNLYHAAC